MNEWGKFIRIYMESVLRFLSNFSTVGEKLGLAYNALMDILHKKQDLISNH